MNLIELTLDEHIKLLNQLGYEVYYDVEEIPNYKNVGIFKNEKLVGNIAYEERNMFYLYRDNRIVGNRDLSTVNFNKRKIKNIRSLIHLRLYDHRLKFNGYNQLVSEDRPYISITDNENYVITKYINEEDICVKSLNEDISDEDILNYLTKSKKEKALTYKFEGVE